MKLEKLTKEQEQLKTVIRDKWVNHLFKNNQPANKEKTRELVNFLYETSKLKIPGILYVKSPLGMQYAANLIKDKKEVRDSVWDSVWDSVRDSVRDSKLQWFSDGNRGGLYDYDWVAFYDFFIQSGITKHELFEKYSRLVFDANIYDLLLFDNLCIVCDKPNIIRRDANNKLHSEENVAIEWEDGYKLYFIHGVNFDEKTFSKITDSKCTFKDLMSLYNTEQRYAALSLENNRTKMLEAGKMINKSQRGNELWEFDSLFDRKAYFVKLICPSTGRVYVEGIDPEVGKRGDADECVAWQLYMTKDEYATLKIER